MTRYHIILDNDHAYTTPSSEDAAQKAIDWLRIGQVSIKTETSTLIYRGLKKKKEDILKDIFEWL